MIDVYDYLDYKKFLNEWLEYKKSENPKYSKRYLAKVLEYDSGFLIRVFQGKKSLNDKLLDSLNTEIGLRRKEMEYFKQLIILDKAKTVSEKKNLLDSIQKLRKSQVKKVQIGQYEYYNKWYYTAIREILDYYNFKDDYSELRKVLDPPILMHEAKKSIQVLEKLGLITKDKQGYYRKTDSVISTGVGGKAVAVANYQLQNLNLAKKAFEKFSEDNRDLSTLTLSLSKGTSDKILSKLKEFRAECLDIASSDDDADRVYQVNFQIFPLTKIKTDKEN